MATVNEELLSATVGHNVDLTHYSNNVVNRMIAILNATDSQLFAQLAAALERLPPESFTVDRLDSLLASVRQLNTQAYNAIGRELPAQLQSLVGYEAGFQAQLFASVIPAQVVARVGIATVNVGQVYSAAMARPFQGVLLREALAGLEAGRAKLVRDAVRMGYVSDETTPQIVSRIRGKRINNYADGLFQAPRRHVESIVRTAISHTAGVTRGNFHKENGDLIKALQWVSTMDDKTTLEFCVPRDGLTYTPDTHRPIGHNFKWGAGPGAIHWCCRSVDTPVLKSWREMGIPIDEMDAKTRASMDGQIPATTTYGDWIKNQSAVRQDQVLGPVRAKLLRDGGLDVSRFFNDKGKLLTLDQLKARDAEVFAKAGV